MSKVEVISMGCRLNLAESNALAEQLADQDDVVIVNSCAVTNEAVRQTRQAIRQARKRRPDARIMVTGCAAQVEPETFRNMPEVSAIFGNAEKQDPVLLNQIVQSPDRPVVVSDIMTLQQTAPHLVTAYSGKTRAFVEVQNGCDHRCTFCIIPYGRGNSRSVPAGSVVEHIRTLVDKGFKEVVLTGVDVTSYGPDLPGKDNLGLLVERILKLVPDLERLRLSSIDGVEIDERLFALLTGEPRLMPHVHLSLQAGDNMILKRMKRRHSREMAIDLVARMKALRPEVAIGADIIAGFPTEDDSMFQNSLDLVRQCQIVHGHIFPYSPKLGTPAAKMPQVPADQIKARAKALREAVAAEHSAWLDRLTGSVQKIAVEKGGRAGHAENFAYVGLNRPMPEGSTVSARIIEIKDGMLHAEVIA
ncbi:tRNA (N(6)-L-threonylcarbamoyladenosine(37)-C(2))-methylthiotransferase MtaB [Sphingorhabdus lacus]|uniref:tRNA (N(6)-L-threonylcarbamoyladenosine(37)-C(2))-methylthiotransferase n=1 Tax=Sphingorhabdus lacus TaxID=392610 RepID=A0A6I6L625_9SPHN|nr:tRNA (N(6)-L-threonylcarbamoyladenosine(37)-C(2))-methylthiotransferase MtaB [Sphingorhabdus lacus]QGY80074.1 tRNA (N(6)-L-threonylcarbamoyladenosine(37)-C(2))-methylthiotransferase MtaB [Sphingorhabdus lacus]